MDRKLPHPEIIVKSVKVFLEVCAHRIHLKQNGDALSPNWMCSNNCRLVEVHTWIEMVLTGLIQGCSCRQVGVHRDGFNRLDPRLFLQAGRGTYLDRDGFDRVDPRLFLQAGRGTYLDRDGFDRVDPGLFLQAGRGT